MEEVKTQKLPISVSTAILIGSVLISLSILLSGGILRFENGKIKLSVARGIGQVAGTQDTPSAPTTPDVAKAQTPPAKVDVSLGHLPVKGDQNTRVTIIEFADFRCPFCEKYFKDTESQIIKNYVNTGKAKYAFRHFAFLGPASILAAEASECANEQGKFWEHHDWLYNNQPDESDISMYTSDKLSSVAANLGMNQSQFKSCLDAHKYAKQVSDDMTDGQKAGVTGTPTVFVNGQIIVGAQPYSVFQSAIDAALK